MYQKKTKPYERLTTIGDHYEITVMDDVSLAGVKHVTFQGELRGWLFEENRDVLYAVIWESGRSRADEYHVGDISVVKPIKKPETKIK